MRIFDVSNNEIESPDLEKGRLEHDKLLIRHHEAVEAVKEEGHWETIREYPNGGKDVDWVIDVEAVEAKEAWDEYEEIQRYIPFTEIELATIEIEELKQKLRDTDYMVIKVMEGVATLDEISEAVKQRAQWRKRINELEGE